VPKLTKAEITAQIVALQAELAESDGGVYADPKTGRWFIVMRAPGRAKTTTRRRAPDGSRLTTREQALIAKGQWESQLARGEVAVGRERFETYWPRYLRHAKGEMTHGSWEDVRAHGSKRLLPYFTGMLMSKIVVAVVRDWRATMLESVEAGEWARKTVNNARVALLGCCRMAVEDGLMAHNPVLDARPLAIEFSERPYLRLEQINLYVDACRPHYRPLAEFLVGTGARVSEAIALRIDDVDLRAGAVKVHKQRVRGESLATRPTKGRNFRTVTIGPGLVDALRDMLALRAEHGTDDGGWLFVCPRTQRGRYADRDEPRPPHRRTVHDWHEQALEDAGLADLPLHGLRHTAAAAWLGTSRSLEFVRAQLGHSSVKVTRDYYGHMEEQFRAAGVADTARPPRRGRATRARPSTARTPPRV
jgi:integrase